MDHPIAAALTRALSALFAPLLIGCGVAAGLVYSGYVITPRSELRAVGEPTPEPAQPQVIVVTAPAAAPRAPEPPPEPVRERPVFVTLGHDEVNDSLTVVDTSRAAVNAILDDSSGLATNVRILPFVEHERVVGFRLYGVRPDSPLSALGLRNGDTVRSVNGIDLTSPDTALETYVRLRAADVLDVRLTRLGRDARLLVLIHDV
jgi:general secretion pathway protein C